LTEKKNNDVTNIGNFLNLREKKRISPSNIHTGRGRYTERTNIAVNRGDLSDTLWLFNIAMDNGPSIDGLPIEHGDFPWLC